MNKMCENITMKLECHYCQGTHSEHCDFCHGRGYVERFDLNDQKLDDKLISLLVILVFFLVVVFSFFNIYLFFFAAY